jgi:hypothetical protein
LASCNKAFNAIYLSSLLFSIPEFLIFHSYFMLFEVWVELYAFDYSLFEIICNRRSKQIYYKSFPYLFEIKCFYPIKYNFFTLQNCFFGSPRINYYYPKYLEVSIPQPNLLRYLCRKLIFSKFSNIKTLNLW